MSNTPRDKEIAFVDLDGILGQSTSPLEIESFAEYVGLSTDARDAIHAKLSEQPKGEYQAKLEEIGTLFAEQLKGKSAEEVKRLAEEWISGKK